MSSVRIANSYLSGALEVAAEYIQNGVRRATNDCVRKYQHGPIPSDLAQQQELVPLDLGLVM